MHDDICKQHSGLESRVGRNEGDIQLLWKAIDRMKNWVIVSAACVIFYFGLTLFNFILSKM